MSPNPTSPLKKTERLGPTWMLALLLVLMAAACGRERGVLAPTLIAINPNRAIAGKTLAVTLTGTNFDAGASINVGAAQIAVSQTQVASPTQIFATFAVASGAAPGAAVISVNSGDATTNAVIFTIAAPLRVSSTNPVSGASGVAVNTLVTASFDQTVNCATVSSSSFTLAGPGGAGVAGTVSCSASTATFTPSQVLASNTAYTATLTTAITNPEGDALATDYTWNFTTAPPPAVTSTDPASGAIGVPVNQSPLLAGFSQPLNCATVSTASFLVSTTAGAPVAGTVSCSGSDAAFVPGTPLAVSTLYTATITTAVTNTAGAPLAGAYSWTFKTAPSPPAPPTVTSTNPSNNATGVPLNQKLVAAFSEAMDPATLSNSTFQLTGPGGVAVAGTVSYSVSGSAATFAPAANLSGLTTYVATITTGAKSLADTAMAASYSWTFTTGAAPDTTKPTVLFTVPAQSATGVPVNQAISATFSKAMNPATITGATFTLTGPAGAAVAGLVSYAANADTATFTPTAKLAASTTYTATVTTGAQDLAGNALGAGGVPNPWTFTTAAAADATPPSITATNPADTATGVAVNATVNATFSKPMDPLTLTTATFQLTDGSGNPVTGTVSYTASTSLATFTPSSNLAANATYTAQVTSGATDLAGNHLAAGAVNNPWIFTTATAVVPAVNLGAATPFGGFGGGAGMTNQGTSTLINGDIGTTGASTVITGFHDPGAGCTYTETPLNIGAVNGTIYTAPPPPTVACPTEGTAATAQIAQNAAAATLAAFNATAPAAMPPTVAAEASELGGLTLPPGVYQSASGSFSITNGDLILDAQGNANATWVFQAATSLTVGIAGPTGARSVILINGAQAKNVFWHVGSAATINAAGGGTMVGTILAQAGVSFSTAGNTALTVLNGRALVLTGPVTMVNTEINVPQP